MKILNLLVLFLLIAQGAGAVGYKLGGVALHKYSVVYSPQADHNEGIDPATALQNTLNELTGRQNTAKPSDQIKKGAVISIVRTPAVGTFDYTVNVRRGHVTIDAGSSWAIRKAADKLIEHIKSDPSKSSFQISGSVCGDFLFPRPEGVNLRILDDNVWDYSADTIPSVWKNAGIDCRDSARAPEFAQIVRAYMPDVLVLQEYSKHMNKEFYPLIKKYGYKNACNSRKGDWNNTPVFYNVDSLDLVSVNYNLYTPSKWSNHGSKSFTSAVFRQKSTGKLFAVINTHLWWKSDRVQPGSTFARTSQVNLMLAEAENIKAKYDCPIFITGDMNCEEKSMPMQQFINNGCVPCYQAATVYGNTDNGHHICAPREVGVRQSRRLGPDRATGAIDHCFIYNPNGAQVKVFDCIQDYFTVKLTDHYPNLIDARL